MFDILKYTFKKSFNKDASNNNSFKKRFKLIFIISTLTSFLLAIAGIIFIYIKLRDPNRNKYNARGLGIAEIINKNYIDGFKDIIDDREVVFTLFINNN